MALAGRAEFEVDGRGGEVCRMRACLVPGDARHAFAGTGDNRMLILDLQAPGVADEDRELLARLFEAPRYPTLDADFQNLLSYAGAELARYGSDPLLARALGGVLLCALSAPMEGLSISWSPGFVVALGYSTFVGTSLSWALWFALIAAGEATRAAAVIFFVPLVSLVIGRVYLHEAVHASLLVGSALVVLGVWLVNRRAPRPSRGSP